MKNESKEGIETVMEAAVTESPAVAEAPETEQLKVQLAEHLAGWQRAKADYANLEKSWQERQGEFMDLAKAAFVLELLPILDHFKLALGHVPEASKAEAWVQGFTHISRELEQFIGKLGLEAIPPVTDFDPAIHEAVSKESSEAPSGAVLREVRTGYRLKDRVIQPVQVVVSTGPVEEANPPPNE